ncbi:2-octaprenyl-3-methyl-6-methoxy-1,4-benzoquinol hydroxylase [Klebsiella variicola]|uniref:2-octaprenyl-3-methyl-6-methoxy-1,4-benzoquinol hydroxylase n=1 Tax=Klebsiella variicola TaxID=244366 RepID=A0A7H4MFR3_KLEVA|nr:2-octaprenyl-3-methyl-6-methoxy-1,4-benzoquinol hydroxylase [Klebsiella variicola]
MTIHATDVAIVGGGMVGGALALGLAQQGFTVTVLEKTAPPAFDPASAPDVRISAISAASVGLLKSLGVWDAVRAMRVHAYRRLETWEWESAHVAFDAAELKLPELGYMVENKVLQWGLWQALAAHEGVTLRVGSELEAMQRGEAHTVLHLREGEAIHARLVIGADGANSQVREMAGIGVHAWQYQQSCMLISVECADDPGDSTWQQFTPQRAARLPAAVRPLGLAGLVRHACADPSAAGHDHGATPAGDRQSLSGAAGSCDAAGGRRFSAHPASCAAVCPARPGAGGRCGAYHSSAGGAGG